jgi:curved DNA-binding protein CbpA
MENWDEWTARIVRAFKALESADYYAVLGIGKDADAEAIRQAYYSRARQLHPDRLVGAPEPGRTQASTIYKRVSEAYQTLSDPDLRQIYDESLSKGEKRLRITSRLTMKPRQDGWFLRTEGGRKHYFAARDALEDGNVPMAKLNIQIAIRHEGELEQLVELAREIEEAG